MKTLITQSCILVEMKPLGIYRAQETLMSAHRTLIPISTSVVDQISPPWQNRLKCARIFHVYAHSSRICAHSLNAPVPARRKLGSQTHARAHRPYACAQDPWCTCKWMTCMCIKPPGFQIESSPNMRPRCPRVRAHAPIAYARTFHTASLRFTEMASNPLCTGHKTHNLPLSENTAPLKIPNHQISITESHRHCPEGPRQNDAAPKDLIIKRA